MSSNEALERLIEGNKRFTQGLRSVESFVSCQKLAELAEKGQSPFAIILTCSDSRVPAEILFDQGIGDLFVIRVAGNVLAPSLLASVEFAALNFKTSLCVVMGHAKCGAIKATLDFRAQGIDPATPSLKTLVKRIDPAIQQVVKEYGKECSGDELLHHATLANVYHTARLILETSSALRERTEAGKFMVVGAMCDIATGAVEFDVPESLSKLAPRPDRRRRASL